MNLDWNDLRYLLEIERAGTIRAAAKQLRLHHTTIARHVSGLQERLGVRLLQRQGRRMVFTDAGEELLETARAVEHTITNASRKLTGQDLRLQGHVRIAAPEAVAHMLAPHMRSLADLYPDISLDLSAGVSFKNLARMEADIVLRVVSSPPDSLVGRRIAPIHIHAYGHSSLLEALEPCTLAEYPWVGWSEHLSHFPMEAWMRQQVPALRAQLTTDTETTLRTWVDNGVGVGFLPSFVGDANPDLRRVTHLDVPSFENQAWILMHEDLRAVPRMQVVSQWLHDTCKPWMVAPTAKPARPPEATPRPLKTQDGTK